MLEALPIHFANPAQGKDAEAGAAVTASVIRTAEEFAELAEDWRTLFDRSGCSNIFLSYEWIHAWWEQLGQGKSLFLIAVRGAKRKLVALAPFCIETSKRLGWSQRVLSFLCSTQACCDHLDILVEPSLETDAASAIAGQLIAHQSEWAHCQLSDTNGDSVGLAALIRELQAAGMLLHREPAGICPYIPLPETCSRFLGSLSKSMRTNLRRYERGLETKGPLQMHCVSAPQEIERAFAELVRLHELRFAERAHPSSFLKPQLQAFHKRLLISAASRGWVRIYLLSVGEQTVAALYGFATGERFFHYQAGMDPAWLRDGVGALCIRGVIEDCISRGETEYDFLRGNEEYKSYWTHVSRRDCTIHLFYPSLMGRMQLTRLRLRNLARSVKRELETRFRDQHRQNGAAKRINPR